MSLTRQLWSKMTDNKVYILVTDYVGRKEEDKHLSVNFAALESHLGSSRNIVDYQISTANSFLILSSSTAYELTVELFAHFNERIIFLITEIDVNNFQGYLSKETWKWISEDILGVEAPKLLPRPTLSDPIE